MILRQIVLMCCLATVSFCATAQSRYPAEARGYEFYAGATWTNLVALESGMADVRRVMGTPRDESDIADYCAPYPGDATAKQPVWRYDLNQEWEILVYFVKSSVPLRNDYPLKDQNLLYSIDYIPRNPRRFDTNSLPSGFRKRHTMAADAAWNNYSDGSGLIYEVYTSHTQYGGNRPGDLNRIVYGPSDEQIRKHTDDWDTNQTTSLRPACISSNLPRVSDSEVVKKGKRRYLKGAEQPYTGIIAGVETGVHVVAWQYTYKDGLPHGEYLHWVDGAIYASNNYEQGEYHGSHKSWYSNGVLRSEGQFLHGAVDGLWIDYNPDGTVARKDLFSEGELVKSESNQTAQVISTEPTAHPER